MKTPKNTTDNNIKNETLSTFAKFVKDKRTAMGLSGSELSRKVFGENCRSYISDIEHGRRNITIDAMNKILKELNSGIVFTEN